MPKEDLRWWGYLWLHAWTAFVVGNEPLRIRKRVKKTVGTGRVVVFSGEMWENEEVSGFKSIQGLAKLFLD